jgi:hypothetical protein
MKALFVTVRVSDAGNLMDAWARGAGYDFDHVSFVLRGQPNDDEIIHKARQCKPDVIMYVGAAAGEGLPSVETLRTLRSIAPSINLCWDSADPPWHQLLQDYRDAECFDLIVGLDGYRDAPVDMVTVTPVNHDAYDGPEFERTTRCGFTGNIPSRERQDMIRALHGTEEQRASILHPLGDLVLIRVRDVTSPYTDYIDFLKHCRLAINTSMTGSGARHHVKGRVVEIPLAGAALLEMREAPTSCWLPKYSYYTYGSIEEAAHLIRTLDDNDIAERAKIARRYVKTRYHPRMIYGAMLARLGM